MNTKAGSFNTGTGAIGTTVVVTGLGFTPKLVWVWWSGMTGTVDAQGNSHQRGFGMFSGATSRHCVASQSVNAVSPTRTDNTLRTDACVCLITNAVSSVVDGLLDVQSMDSGGFTLVVDDVFTASYRVHYWAIGGDEITDVVRGETPTIVAGGQTINLGFQPDMVFFMAPGAGQASGTISSDSRITLGCAVRPNETNMAWSGGSNDNANNPVTANYTLSGQSAVNLGAALTTVTTRGILQTWLDGGFSMNYLEVSANMEFQYFAVKGGSWSLGSFARTISGTQNIPVTDLGFSPKGGLFLSSTVTEAVNDTVNVDDSWSMGAFSDAATQVDMGSYDLWDLTLTSTVRKWVGHNEVWRYLRTSAEAYMQVTSVTTDGFNVSLVANGSPGVTPWTWFLAAGDETPIASQVQIQFF